MTGDRRLEARPLIARMASRGWVCVSIDYRLSPRATWPDHIVDVKTALAWVHDHVAEHGGDPNFVACVPFYGVYDFANTLGQRAPAEMRIVERFIVKARQVDQPTTYEHAAPLARVNEHAPRSS